MKKLIFSLIILAFLPSIKASAVSIQWNKGDAVAVAFLGYHYSYEGLCDSEDYSRLVKLYPELKQIKGLTVDQPGEEFYLIIPRSKNAQVTINSYSFDAFNGNTDNEKILYRDDNSIAKPFLVKGNESDALGNMSINVISREGTVTDYVPHLNLQDGNLAYQAGVVDISRPLPSPIVSAYLSDPVGKFTNVRVAPKGAVKVKLTQGDYEPCFGLKDYNNGWWKIAGCSDATDSSPAYEKLCNKANGGYIHYSCVGIGTRNYSNQELPLYETANPKSKVVYIIKEETTVRPVGVARGGMWVKVKTADGKHEGWIQSEWLCSNPLTNCC